MRIVLANPRGFCAGVDRAIEIVKRALNLFGEPIYVRHEVVHNRIVVAELQQKGVIFVEHINEIPRGSTAIFSAHGVSQVVREAAKQRNLRIFDATCPLVTKVHIEVARYNRLGQECVLIGHADHPEVEGSLGHYDNPDGGIYLVENIRDVALLKVKNPLLLSYVTQTTLSLDDTKSIIQALKQRFPKITTPKKEDICYATQNRQFAVKELAKQCDMVLVLGSVNSSNSNRLKELAERLGKPAYLIDSAEDIPTSWLIEKESIGITAGASAPEFLVQDVVTYIKTFPNWRDCLVSELMGIKENVAFALPRELRIPLAIETETLN
ncbi:4-hydroxy-3-methylbut-2-enyl diphosphate reductase [Candidatus Rickettsiella isopodorum]|jgi:4-hydroxy-3-methylbut-2-enyl diphosphate reductase|uniref:4-hydroxy-3-methylbut-2-enyl diphosphate reductase n=1 Tax=Candidatus Rickettsiella isopodorum TaxID=1225476 RepID=A0A1J8P685_9COXI|nr:4-hydroxy-3-methylbut-2-enyl diphosphate reductase [Candidatus Rickettsiella isopodorum]OIZ94483.1 4-hydroxy-3-methylbut-2-enyl diphosphate reductase [Candidatus Rickettsiella isopodorum]